MMALSKEEDDDDDNLMRRKNKPAPPLPRHGRDHAQPSLSAFYRQRENFR